MTMYDISCVPAGAVYDSILEVGLRYCAEVLFVVRKGLPLSASGQSVIARLAELETCRSEESEWPGTVLLCETATVHRFRYNFAVFEILRDAAQCFFDWHQPALPEDLCLLRRDGTPWFVCISHEGDCYFELSEQDAATIQAEMPQFCKLSVHVDEDSVDEDEY